MIAFGRQEVASFIAKALTKRQLEIFLSVRNLQNLTFSGVVRELSKSYPQSTIKYVLKYLKGLGLVYFENCKPLELTPLGLIVQTNNAFNSAEEARI